MKTIITLMALAALPAQAESIPGFTQEVSTTVIQMETAIAAWEAERDDSHHHPFKPTQFFVDLNPYVSFGVPGLADVTISPDIEFVWEHVTPENWVER